MASHRLIDQDCLLDLLDKLCGARVDRRSSESADVVGDNGSVGDRFKWFHTQAYTHFSPAAMFGQVVVHIRSITMWIRPAGIKWFRLDGGSGHKSPAWIAHSERCYADTIATTLLCVCFCVRTQSRTRKRCIRWMRIYLLHACICICMLCLCDMLRRLSDSDWDIKHDNASVASASNQ